MQDISFFSAQSSTLEHRYTPSKKNPSAWYFVRPARAVTWCTVAIIIQVVLLAPYLCIRRVSLSFIHHNQSHRVHIYQRTIHLLDLKLKHQLNFINFPRRDATYAAGDGWVDRTAPLLLSAAVIQAVECVVAVAFGKKLCWFESHCRHISLCGRGSWTCASSSLRKETTKVIRRKLLAFISAENWPSGSPDLTPLDSKLWAACFEEHGLPKGSQQPGEPKEIPCEGSGCDPMVTVCVVIPEWPERLKACVEEEGGHFEWHYYK